MSISYCSNASWDCDDILIERILGVWKEVSCIMNVPVIRQSYVDSWNLVDQLEAGLSCCTFDAWGRQKDQRIDVAQSTVMYPRDALVCPDRQTCILSR
jgi:hypothetical protein